MVPVVASGASPAFPVLSAVVLTPVIGALVVALISKRRPELAKQAAVLFSTATGALAIGIAVLFDKADGGFHMAVFAASHNPFFRRLGTVVHDVLSATFNAEHAIANHTAAETKRLIAEDIAVHARLFDAIAQKDPARAEEHIRAIITFARANLSRAVSGA